MKSVFSSFLQPLSRRFLAARAIEVLVWQPARAWVARFFGLRRLRIRTLDELATADLTLGPSDDFAVCARFSEPTTLQNTLPPQTLGPISAHVLADVDLSLSRRGGFAVRGNDLVTRGTWGPSHPKIYFPNSSVAGEAYQSEGHIYVAIEQSQVALPKGIFVGSFAPHNWFHWTVDTLPLVLALRDLPPKYASYPLILPAGSIAKKSWREALAAVNPGRQVLELPTDVFVRVESLIMVDGATNGYPRPLHWPLGVPRILVRFRALTDYRHHVLGHIETSSRPTELTPERIFVGRRQQTGRNYNQDQIFAIAVRFGFTMVFLEDMSFADSVRLFARAKFVVAPHGAGLANALFSDPATRILFWTWDDPRGDNWYENVFFVAGVGACRMVVRPEDRAGGKSDPREADYFLDPQEFEARLEELLLSSPNVS